MKNFKSLIIYFTLIMGGTAFGQVNISGFVNDERGEPVIGASVELKIDRVKTVTDTKGFFSLTGTKYSEIEISSFGKISKKLLPTGELVKVTLEDDKEVLDETVVVGYTSKKRNEITGSVAVVDVSKLSKTPFSDLTQALQGRVAGLIGTQDGQPGSGRNSIRVRGMTTLNNNSPLYVIDGVPSSEGLTNLNPADIASIQVLKDAASASVYGSRSAGGVIVITTNKGLKDKTSIQYGSVLGLQVTANKLDMLDAQGWGEVYWMAAKNDGLTPRHPLYGDGATPVINTVPFVISNQRQIYQFTENGTSWHDEVYRPAFQQQHNVNFSSGTDRSSYALGISNFKQNGLIRRTNYERTTLRFNSSFKATDWLTVGENVNLAYSDQTQIGTQQGQDGIPMDVIRQHPMLPVYDYQGGFAGRIAGMPDVRNMVSVLEKNKNNWNRSVRVFANFYGELDILAALVPGGLKNQTWTARTSAAIDYSDYRNKNFNASFQEGDYDVQNNFLYRDFGEGRTLTLTNTSEYKLKVGESSFKVLGGMEAIEYDFTYFGASRTGFGIEEDYFTYLSAGSGDQTNFGGGTGYGLLSYFTNADYDFAGKYFISGVLRHDRTSRFNSGGIFPAGSVGWRISEEGFFKPIKKTVNELKLRASWGMQGNQNTADFATLSTFGFNPNTADYDLNGSNTDVVQGLVVATRGNPNLKWETTTQTNLGVDFGLFNNKLTSSIDVYKKLTTDILLPNPQISAVGEGNFPIVNAASMENIGLDWEFSYQKENLAKKRGYRVDLVFSTFRNKVLSLGENIGNIGYDGEYYIDGADGPSRIAVGYALGSFYGWVADGIFNSEEEVANHAYQLGAAPGRIRYADINGDSVISAEDRTYLGSPFPKFTLSGNYSYHIGNWDFIVFAYANVGQQVYNETKWYTDFAQNGNFNHGTAMLNAWSTQNLTSRIPAPTLNNNNNESRASSYFVENASFLRLRSLKATYSVPLKDQKTLSFSLEGQNLFVLTDYSGVDPEVTFSNNANFPGIDRGVYPLARTVLFGVNFKM
jgi:TonB-linked SusC/RagA family outer membrane protein